MDSDFIKSLKFTQALKNTFQKEFERLGEQINQEKLLIPPNRQKQQKIKQIIQQQKEMSSKSSTADQLVAIFINQKSSVKQKTDNIKAIIGEDRFKQLRKSYNKRSNAIDIKTKEGIEDFGNYVIRNYRPQSIDMSQQEENKLFEDVDIESLTSKQKLPTQIQNIIDEESDIISDIGKELKIQPEIIDYIDSSARRNIIEEPIHNPNDIIGEALAEYRTSRQFKEIGSQLQKKQVIEQLKEFAQQFREQAEQNIRIQENLQQLREDPNIISAISKIQQRFREQRKNPKTEQLKQRVARIRKDDIDQQYQREQQEQLDQKLADRKAQLLKDILNKHNLPNPNLQQLVQPSKPLNLTLTKNQQRLKKINKENKKRVSNEEQLEKDKLPQSVQQKVSKKTGLRITELCC